MHVSGTVRSGGEGRLSLPDGARTAIAGSLACAALLLIACGRTEQGEVGQRIDMGPYTFEVGGAKKGRTQISDRRMASIEVLFRLRRDDTAPFTTDFDHSFRNRMQLVDTFGNTFAVFLHPNTQEYEMSLNGEMKPVAGYWPTSREVYRAGRRRADTYRASIAIDPLYVGRGMKIQQREHIGETVSDFRLIIDNPRREGDQPGRVVIQLH